MRVLMISYDRNMFIDGSDAHANALSYGSFMDELHVIVFSRRSHGLKKKKIRNNVFLYPTNGILAWISIFKAISIGNRIRDVDVITTQDPFESGLVGYILKKVKRVPLQLQVHGDFFCSEHWLRESILNGWRRTFGKILLRRADCIRVVSERVEKPLVALGIPKEKIVRNPISISKSYQADKKQSTDLRRTHPDADFIFLSISRFVKVKNLELLIRSFNEVLKKYPRSLLVLVGRGPEEQNLRRIAKELDIEKRVVFKEWTNDPISLYKTADVYVLSSNYEGWGKVVVEAMTSGLPVIMTDVGCAREVVKDRESGLIVPVGNKEKLVDAMINIMEQDVLRERLRKNGQMRVKELPTYDEYVQRYRESLELCLQRKREKNR